MHIRDQELNRLEKYAEGLGTSIEYKEHSPGDPGAAWILSEDGSSVIEAYIWPRQSKTQLVLNILHELGHNLGFIYRNRKEHPETFDAFYQEDKRKKDTDPLLPKEARKLIYLSEKEDAEYRKFIWHEVGIKIPKWKLDLDIALDNYIYKCYYLTGNTPNYKQIHKARQRWLKRHLKLK